jgi:hypothetical protein
MVEDAANVGAGDHPLAELSIVGMAHPPSARLISDAPLRRFGRRL